MKSIIWIIVLALIMAKLVVMVVSFCFNDTVKFAEESAKIGNKTQEQIRRKIENRN